MSTTTAYTLISHLHKGVRSTHNPNPLYAFTLNFDYLPPSYYSLISLDFVSIPKSTREAMANHNWQQPMLAEMAAQDANNTWELVPLPPNKFTVGCHWIYTMKIAPYGTIDRYKARLVAKGYIQIFGLDYCDTLSPVTKMTSIHLFHAMTAI